ncbi:MAG: ATP synthase F1 subunit epsilon [Acidimicrobiaceae bacterium]|nr:ATP synthase F1 subunit epsilon [Acidimicrobiaceae bacterium]
MATLKVEIVTPESALWVGEANALIARSSEGEFTILPQHTETVGDIVPGVVRVETSDGEIAFAIHGGYFQVSPDGSEGVTLATVLAGVAEKTTDIDVARAQVAKEAAEAKMNEATRADQHDTASHLVAHAALERAELRLRSASR